MIYHLIHKKLYYGRIYFTMINITDNNLIICQFTGNFVFPIKSVIRNINSLIILKTSLWGIHKYVYNSTNYHGKK